MELKYIYFFCAIIILSIIVYAMNLQTVYNPFTGKLDYVRNSNFSEENLTANYFIGSGANLFSVNETDPFKGNANLHLHDAANITNEKWVNETGDTMTGNLTFGDNKYICLGNSGCSDSYIYFNGSSLIFKVN